MLKDIGQRKNGTKSEKTEKNTFRFFVHSLRGVGSKALGHQAAGREATNLGQTTGKSTNFTIFMRARGKSASAIKSLHSSYK